MENAHNNPKSKTMKNLFSQQPTFSNPPHSSKITLISTPSQNYPSSVNNNSLSQSTKLDKVVGNFSTRASGKIYFNSPSN